MKRTNGVSPIYLKAFTAPKKYNAIGKNEIVLISIKTQDFLKIPTINVTQEMKNESCQRNKIVLGSTILPSPF
ncbi:hypothetical protein [Lysinibacillus sp. NPDC056232]|uniref:hypothetical protein n=1 Tax=Lysinibacillus sp. NPDC056232 TaxID=3345756 RepID=UPI0035DEDE55